LESASCSLAPTDARRYDVGDSLIPDRYAFMTILPAADGDVSSNHGAKFYDTNEPVPLKSQLYVDFANHNFFNREWVKDEDDRPLYDLLARGEHERILSRYGCAFFRAFLLGHNTTDFLTYRALPPGINTGNVHLSFEWADQLTVDHHEDGNGIGRNSLDEPTTQSGVSTDEYTLERNPPGPYSPPTYSPNTFWGDTVGMVVECEQQFGFFRSQLDGEYDLTAPQYEIWVRAAEVSGGSSNPSDATGFELGMEDKEGLRAWTDSDSVGGLPRPFDRPASNGR
jgi:hypothetical protein